jgi:hypothetical protein
MKINPFTIIISTCFLSMALFSCESHEQSADDAFENVKEEKTKLKDSVIVAKELIPETNKTEPVRKTESIDEWTKFKMDAEKKITANEITIKTIKGIPNANAKLLRQVTSLEKDNNDLRKQMDVYKEEVKVMWENFKTKINHDVNEISIELKDLTVNNK